MTFFKGHTSIFDSVSTAPFSSVETIAMPDIDTLEIDETTFAGINPERDPLDSIPQAREVLRILELDGNEAWIVGGWVRDVVLQRACIDVDITTSMHPEDVIAVFRDAGWQTIPTGIQHGTVTVVAPEMLLEDPCCAERHASNETLSFEITTYRSEGTYQDARHPDDVTYIESIEEDLSRRDFTCNAIAYHPERGIVDPFDGISDIRYAKLRAVGNPDLRFQEDALRILRGLRFSAQLGFAIEDATAQAMIANRHLMQQLSAERISHELTLLLCAQNVQDVLLAYPEIICEAIPELAPCVGFDQHTRYHCYDVYEHIARTVALTPPTPIDRWVALLHDIGKPKTFFTDKDGSGHFFGHGQESDRIARNLLERLRMPSRFIDDACLLIHYHDSQITLNPKSIKRVLRRFGDLTDNLLNIKRADSLTHAPAYRERARNIDAIKDLIASVESQGEPYTLKQLAISGNDLIDMGFKPGPVIGLALDACLNDVINETVPNEKNALLSHVQELSSILNEKLQEGADTSQKAEPVSSHGVPLL